MFRTAITPAKSPVSISMEAPIFSGGSCFAATIGQRLLSHKFKAMVNPFGVIFNPVTLLQLIQLALKGKPLPSQGFIQRDDLWFHHLLHSQHFAPTQEALAENATLALNQAGKQLKHAQWIILTFGSAWVYRHNNTGMLVSNNHKVPASEFTKELLSVEQVVKAFTEVRNLVLQHNPNINFVLTVSPVRHLRDTLPLNSVSKACLRLACHQLAESFTEVQYFPAFELLLDDLRDYRFFADDMLHPSLQAEEYIWESFVKAYFTEEAQQFVTSWKALQRQLAHKPLHPGTRGHLAFLQQTLAKLKAFPHPVNLESEISNINSLIEQLQHQ